MLTVIPEPQETSKSFGTFDLYKNKIKVNSDNVSLKVFTELIPNNKWECDNTLPKFTLKCGSSTISCPPKLLQCESYYLRISQDGVFAQGVDNAGLYYAVQTLAQLQRNADSREIPCCEITDYPNFPLRIYHDDISRGQVSKLEDFKRILQIIGRYKINAYIPYIEDMLYLSQFPDIGKDRGRLTHEEVREIQAEAKRHHIRVIPAFCLLGHCENLLAMPKYSHLGRKVPFLPSSFDVNNPELKSFLRKVIAEVANLFEDELLHGGFDEVRGLSCKEFCKHVEWVACELRKYGKRLVIYYDMFINHFGCDAAEKLSEDIVFANWNYSALEDFSGEKELALSKHQHWILAGLNNCCQLSPELKTASINIRNFLAQGRECGASAAVVTGWGDNGYENQRDVNWNLVAYFANQAWNGSKTDLNSFLQSFHQTFYGKQLPELAELLLDISDIHFAGIPAWKLWHTTLWAMERIIHFNPELVKVCRDMLPDIKNWKNTLNNVQNKLLIEKSHINHYYLFVKRIESIVSRILTADKTCELRRKILKCKEPKKVESLKNNLTKICKEEKNKLDKLGEFYSKLWLTHNKSENLEWSYSWYKKLGKDYESPLLEEKANGEIINLDNFYNESPLEIFGIPKGNIVYDNINFHISEFGNFSVELKPKGKVIIPFKKNMNVRDINILLAGSNVPNKDLASISIELIYNNNIIYEDLLLSRKHIPDWYAPKGDMWAGSACLFVDKARTKLVWDGIGMSQGVAPFFGLFKLNNFNINDNHVASSVIFKNMSTKLTLHIIALTLA